MIDNEGIHGQSNDTPYLSHLSLFLLGDKNKTKQKNMENFPGIQTCPVGFGQSRYFCLIFFFFLEVKIIHRYHKKFEKSDDFLKKKITKFSDF